MTRHARHARHRACRRCPRTFSWLAGALLAALSIGPGIATAQPVTPDRLQACFAFAGHRYGVSPLLLQAIAQQESGMNPHAVNRNANGTTDLGLMQINSSWLPTLARHGVTEADLRVPCANILVGAWILGSNFREMGRTVEALGAYNARDPVKRLAYARQVLGRYVALREGRGSGTSAAGREPLNPSPTPPDRRSTSPPSRG